MTKTVTIAATRAGGEPYAHHDVIVTLVAGSAGGVVGSNVIVEQSTVKLDADGTGSITLRTNDVEITSPSTSFYRFTVADSSPTITRSIRLTDDLPSSVSWTLAGIQVGDPTIPQRDVSSDYVTISGQSLTNYLAANLTHRVSVFASDFDASGGSFTVIPAVGVGDIQREFLVGGDVLVVDGADLGLWTITASGPCTAGVLTPGDVVASGLGQLAVAATAGGPTVTAVVVFADADDLADVTGAGLALADYTRAETLARIQTEPLLGLCTPWGSGHDDGAYFTDAPGSFTDGLWLRFTVTPLPVPDFGVGTDGELRYGELFTWTGDGIGIWDIIEAAVERKYDAAAGVWRAHLFLELTEVGGTTETISLSTSSQSGDATTTYPVWELPEGVPTECAIWFRCDNGDGAWDLRFLRRTHNGTPTLTVDGAEWKIIAAGQGTTTGSIASSVEQWGIGEGNGAVLLNEMQVRDVGPTGTLLAHPTAALAAAAGEGQPFIDAQGNEWTPGPDATIVLPTTGGGAVDSVNGQTGVVVLDAADVGADPAGTAAALVDDLSGVTNASAARSALGLGTAALSATGDFATAGHNHSGTYQPLDSDLSALAALTTTSFGRALLELADAAAARTAIGAMASTATLPWHDDFTVLHTVRDPLPVTGTYTQTPGALRGGGYTLSQTGTGWVFTYARIPLRAGTYTRRYVARTDSNSGIVTFTIGGISAGTADGYSVGNVNDVVFDATGIVIPSDGFYDLVLTSTTKNASSAGYRANAQLTRLFRTGA